MVNLGIYGIILVAMNSSGVPSGGGCSSVSSAWCRLYGALYAATSSTSSGYSRIRRPTTWSGPYRARCVGTLWCGGSSDDRRHRDGAALLLLINHSVSKEPLPRRGAVQAATGTRTWIDSEFDATHARTGVVFFVARFRGALHLSTASSVNGCSSKVSCTACPHPIRRS